MAKGSCLCDAVAFEIDDRGMVLSVGCFCRNCRKVSGSQCGVYLQVRRDSFRRVSGEDETVAYGWCSADAASQIFADAGPQELWSGMVRRLYARG